MTEKSLSGQTRHETDETCSDEDIIFSLISLQVKDSVKI